MGIYDVSEYQRELWRYHQLVDGGAARAAVRDGEGRYAGFDGFAGEVFHRLYADPPKRAEAAGPEAEVWKALHDAIDGVPEFEDLRQRTVGSERWAGTAAAATLDTLLAKVTAPEEQVPDASDDAALQASLRWLLDQTQDPDGREAVQAAIDESQAEHDAKVQKIGQAAGLIDPTEVRNAVRAAAQAAKEALDAEQQLVDGWGAGQDPHSGRRERAALGARLAAMAKNNDRIKKIAEMAGRLRRIADAKQRAKPQEGATEVTGIELGDDLGRLCPAGALLALDPDTEVAFARTWLERGLPVWELRDRPEEKRGPIVLVVDSSGSMGGAPADWAAAVTLAFADIAARQRRAFGVLHFGTRVLKTEVFEAGKAPSPERLAEAVTFFEASGGTAFEPALNRAAKVIEQTGALRQADVVMITDGFCSVSDLWVKEWNARRRTSGMRCYSILIGMRPEYSVNAQFSDSVVELADVLADDAGMHGLFGRV